MIDTEPPPAETARSTAPQRIHAATRVLRRLRESMSGASLSRGSAALSAMLAALLLSSAVWLTIGSPVSTRAADVVSDYLESLRAGDTESALEIAGVEDRPSNDEFLTADAASSDWRVDSVTEYIDEADNVLAHVRVRISDDAGHSTRGDFVVEEISSGDWRIANPFAMVRVTANRGPTYLELNGVTAALPSKRNEFREYPVFPGSYELYSKNSSLFTVDPGRGLLLPVGSLTGEEPEPLQDIAFDITLTGKGQKSAQRALKSLVDDCVESSDLAPDGCPFTAKDDLRGEWVETDAQYFSEVKDVSWNVREHPKVVTYADGTGFGMSIRNDTTVTLNATGVPVFGDDEKRTEFTAECPFSLGTLELRPSTSGDFSIVANESEYLSSDCELAR